AYTRADQLLLYPTPRTTVSRQARGAPPPLDRGGGPRVSRVQGREHAGEGGRRLLARRRDRAVLDAALVGRSPVLGEVVSGGLHHREPRAGATLVLLPAVLQRRPHRARAVRGVPVQRVRVRRERRGVPQDRRQLHRFPAGGGAGRGRRRPLVLLAS